MASVTLTLKGKLAPLIMDATAQLRDMRDLMEEIAQILDESVSSNFREQRSPYGVDWLSHSPTTRALYARGGLFGRTRGGRGSRRVLIRTGVLMNSITPKHNKNSAHVSVTGRAVKYGYVHQFGNPNNRLPNKRSGNPAPIPARPFMAIGPDGKTQLPDSVMQEIRTAAANYFAEFKG